MKEIQLLLKDLSELWGVKSTSAWLQKMCILWIKLYSGKYIPYHRTKTKPPDVKSGGYDLVKISKYKRSSIKGYTPNWSEEVFVF